MIHYAAIRSHVHKPQVLEHIEGYVDENEMLTCFMNELNLDLFETEKSRRFYQWNRLTHEEYAEKARRAFKQMLRTVRTRAKVRTKS